MLFNYLLSVLFFALMGTGLGQIVNGSTLDNSTAGPPASEFAGGSTMSLAILQSEVAKVSKPALEGTYPIHSGGNAAQVTIYSDWAGFRKVRNNFFLITHLEVDHLNRAPHLFSSQTWMLTAMAWTGSARFV